MTAVPSYDTFFNPVLKALRQLGGSATNAELDEKIIELEAISDEVAEVPHGESAQSEVGYRIAWARTYLKKYGLIENSQRGVWSLTPKGAATTTVKRSEVKQFVKELDQKKNNETKHTRSKDSGRTDEDEVEDAWRTEALEVMKAMDPIAFERLCQRLLRESGFIEVEVTKSGGDGGIDGRGVLRIGGLISFTVMFQAKRYKDTVGAAVVRDFRGAVMGRADKGLIITTGRFTQDASKEATRDGATPIDLIDGTLLTEKLKELSLGIRTQMVERVSVDPDWFERL